jgi:hypothetical protein
MAEAWLDVYVSSTVAHLDGPRAIILFLGLSLSLSSLIAVVSGAVAQQLLAGLCPAGPNPFNLR